MMQMADFTENQLLANKISFRNKPNLSAAANPRIIRMGSLLFNTKFWSAAENASFLFST